MMFDNWKEEYGLQYEPNYSEHTEKDCKSAFAAGQQSQQADIDELKKLRSLDEMAINQLAQANQVWRTKCDELQARVDDHDLKLELFINELEKTYRYDKDNKIDYWRGFSECADASVKVFYRDVGFINLKGK